MKTTQSTKWPSSNTRCGSDFPGRLAVKFKLRLHERGKNYVVDSYLLPPRKTGKITGKSHLALRGLVKTESETKSSSLVHILGVNCVILTISMKFSPTIVLHLLKR